MKRKIIFTLVIIVANHLVMTFYSQVIAEVQVAQNTLMLNLNKQEQEDINILSSLSMVIMED